MRVAILTISDAGARGERADTSGDAAETWARARGYEVTERALIPDETVDIVNRLVARVLLVPAKGRQLGRNHRRL